MDDSGSLRRPTQDGRERMILLLQHPRLDVGHVFASSVQAQARLKRSTFTIESQTYGQGKSYRNRFTVTYERPARLLIRIEALPTQDQQPSDRTYFMEGNKMVAIDREANEYMVRTEAVSGSLGNRAAVLIGAIDDSVRMVLDPNDLEKFLGQFRALTGWNASSKGGTTLSHLTVRKGKKTWLTLQFAPDSVIRGVKISSKGALLSWSYRRESEPKSLSLSVPHGYRRVASFMDTSIKGKFSTKAAEKIWAAATRAYAKLRSVAMSVSDQGKEVSVQFSGAHAMQREAGLAWSYDGKLLTLVKNGRFYRGRVGASDIPGKVGVQIEPTLRSWALHSNPARALVDNFTSIRTTGMVVVDSVPCDALEIRRGGLRVSVLVRRSDHLFAHVSSVNEDSAGRKLSSSDREFKYRSIGRILPASAFALHPARGQRIEKLR